MKHYIMFAVCLAFLPFLATAEEQILFVSDRHGNDEIYMQFLGGRPERITFDEGRDVDPALSPDGRRMAYVTTINRVFQIAVLDLKSRKRQQLTFSPKRNLSPTWSPDGDRIAFASDRDGNMDIYVMDANGKNATNMTAISSGDDASPHWSPVSQKVVFTSNRIAGVVEVYLLDVQTGDQRKLTTSSYFAAYPRWSPDGSQIAYVSAEPPDRPQHTRAIWRMKPDGTDLETLVTDGEPNLHPKFSPDGKWIAFDSKRDLNSDIYALNLETQELNRLTTHLGDDFYPVWSPDGERIVFISTRDGNFDLFTMTTDREQLTNLTKSSMLEACPTWSPDGEKIAFSRFLGDTSAKIYVMDNTGENEVLLVDLPFVNFFPAWSPAGDKIAFVNYPDRRVQGARIYTVDHDGKNLEVVYENPEESIRRIAWSRDATQILFEEIGNRIGFLNIETNEVRTLNVPVRGLFASDLSPDGQYVIFSAYPELETANPRIGVFIIDRDGNPVRTFLMDTPPWTTGGLAWSPDGTKILFGHDGGLHTLDLDTEAIELFIENARDPDWQDSSLPRSVTPQNKLNTIWGEKKTGETR